MFSKKAFADLRRSGMGVGVSVAKLTEAMLEILIQIPSGSTNLKETIIAHIGLLGQMASSRDLNQAWNQTKKKAAKQYPEKFILDTRGTLKWNDGKVKILDKEISSANIKKLNELADAAGYNVNGMVTELIKVYKKNKG